MPEPAIICPKCHVPVPAEPDQEDEERCPSCRTVLSIQAFPRLGAADSGKRSLDGNHAAEGEAVCHFYPELQAETICDECGCFLSLKAAVDWNGRNICLPCLHKLRGEQGGRRLPGKADHLRQRRAGPGDLAGAVQPDYGAVGALLPVPLPESPTRDRAAKLISLVVGPGIIDWLARRLDFPFRDLGRHDCPGDGGLIVVMT